MEDVADKLYNILHKIKLNHGAFYLVRDVRSIVYSHRKKTYNSFNIEYMLADLAHLFGINPYTKEAMRELMIIDKRVRYIVIFELLINTDGAINLQKVKNELTSLGLKSISFKRMLREYVKLRYINKDPEFVYMAEKAERLMSKI